MDETRYGRPPRGDSATTILETVYICPFRHLRHLSGCTHGISHVLRRIEYTAYDVLTQSMSRLVSFRRIQVLSDVSKRHQRGVQGDRRSGHLSLVDAIKYFDIILMMVQTCTTFVP